MRLVDVEEEGPALRFVRVRLGEGREFQLIDQERPEERRDVLAQAPIGEVCEKDLAPVYEGAKGKSAPPLADDVSEKGRGDKLAGLVEDGRDGLGAEGGAVDGELLLAELEELGVY